MNNPLAQDQRPGPDRRSGPGWPGRAARATGGASRSWPTPRSSSEFLHREFPEQASEWTDPTSRRHFLQLMGASLALAGVGAGASTPSRPRRSCPTSGRPRRSCRASRSTTPRRSRSAGIGIGVLAESHMGRPTMLEGNDTHPDSLGAIDPFAQASLLTLYDPDRSQVVTRRGERSAPGTRSSLTAIAALDAQRPKKGTGLRVLTETVTSPTLARQLRELLDEFPEAKWHQYEPAGRDARPRRAELAFGDDVATRYHVEKADVILALDADFLAGGPGHLPHARDFAPRREPTRRRAMNRLYAVEPTPTITGAMADHRLPLRRTGTSPRSRRPSRRKLGVPGSRPPRRGDRPRHKRAGSTRWSRDLQKNKGTSLVVAGDGQPPMSTPWRTRSTTPGQRRQDGRRTPSRSRPSRSTRSASLAELCRATMEAGAVEVLLILGGNPAYTAPADLGFAEAAGQGQAQRATWASTTTRPRPLCDWHVPEAHELEAWGDVRASDGTATIQQPLIAPLYGGRSAIELIAALLRHPEPLGLRHRPRHLAGEKRPKGEDFETFWRTSVHDGVVAETDAAGQGRRRSRTT